MTGNKLLGVLFQTRHNRRYPLIFLVVGIKRIITLAISDINAAVIMYQNGHHADNWGATTTHLLNQPLGLEKHLGE